METRPSVLGICSTMEPWFIPPTILKLMTAVCIDIKMASLPVLEKDTFRLCSILMSCCIPMGKISILTGTADRERISKNYDNSIFAQKRVFSVYTDKHFVLVENDGDENYVLSECVPGQDLIDITKTDSSSVSVSKNFDWVAYQKKGNQYLAHKTGGEWEDRIKVMDDVSYAQFDEDYRYLYCLSTGGDFWALCAGHG